MKKLFIISEIGVNHDGDIKKAFKLIDISKKFGANAVKFQTYKTKNFVSLNTPKVKYQKTQTNENHYQMLKKLELTFEEFFKIKKYCDTKNIEFISTPYDLESLFFLKKINVKKFKIASADLSDIPMHLELSKMKKKVILSTGMSNIQSIKKTLSYYKNKKNIELLHCVSVYPCPLENLNLNNITTLKEKFKLPVGFSDHSKGYEAAIIAYMLGSRVFEKHFTLSTKSSGPDHKSSSDPREFLLYINKLKQIDQILGSKFKKISKEEIEMKMISEKSITLAKEIGRGEKLNKNYLIMKRPGFGINGYQYLKVSKKKVNKNLPKNYQIKKKDFL